jgi:hypothetical protein
MVCNHTFNYYSISKRYRCIKCQLVTKEIGKNDKLLRKIKNDN